MDARGEGFNPDLHTAAVDRIMAVFNDVYFQQQRGGGCESELPVFVLGMPRSGTTLVEQVIASHPKVY
ncbi:MAG: sulfotransferase, partial [Rhodospirillaceae bacterium]|nr:sulfotransferase [Rhodospirillaceae bacterium]